MQDLRESADRLVRRSWFVPLLIGTLALVLLTAWLLLPPPSEAAKNIRKAQENQKIADPGDFVTIYLPKALLLDLGLCAVLFMTWRRSRRELSARHDDGIQHVKSKDRRMLWTVVALTTLVSGVLDAPRLKLSLWNDEVTALRFFMVGGVRRVKKDSSLRVEPAPWRQTAFGYWRPNNHVLYSMAARLSHEAWPKNRSRTSPYFNEAALRLPAFLTGMAALAMLGGLALKLNLPHVGMVSVVLLALHPWHVRFATEARGYAFLLLLTPALLLCLVEGARTGRWRWWLGAGIIEFLLLYSVPLSFYVIVPAVLSTGLLIMTQWKTGRDRAILLMRMVTGSLLGAMIALPLMLPLFPQVRQFLEARVTHGQINSDWLLRGLSELFTGVAWRKIDPSNPYTRPWEQLASTHPWVVGGGILSMALVLLAGVLFLWRRSTVTRCLLPVLLLPSILVTGVGAMKNLLVYHQYLVIGLPGLMLVMAAGVVALAQMSVPRSMREGWPALLASGLACILFGAATHHQRKIMRTFPMEPRRDAALVYHKTLNPRDPRMNDVVSAAFTPDRAYDPGSHTVVTGKDVQDIADQALKLERPLYLSYHRNDPEAPGIVEKLEQFEWVKTLYGTVEESSISIYRYRERAR